MLLLLLRLLWCLLHSCHSRCARRRCAICCASLIAQLLLPHLRRLRQLMDLESLTASNMLYTELFHRASHLQRSMQDAGQLKRERHSVQY